METIKVNGEFLFELANKQQWINRVPEILPEKIRPSEKLLWVDKNNNTFELGKDFEAADANFTFPCKVYRLCSVSAWAKNKESSKLILHKLLVKTTVSERGRFCCYTQYNGFSIEIRGDNIGVVAQMQHRLFDEPVDITWAAIEFINDQTQNFLSVPKK